MNTKTLYETGAKPKKSEKNQMKMISTERLDLRVIDESFVNLVLDFVERNRTFLKEWEATRSEEYYKVDYQKCLLSEDLKNINEGSLYKVWIFKKSDKENKIIGSVALNNIIRGCFQSCHLGYKIDKNERNKGYMTEAVKSVIDYGFNVLKLHRIEANIMPRNIASIKVVEKLGFVSEGLAKKYLKINDAWEDHIHMVLLNDNE